MSMGSLHDAGYAKGREEAASEIERLRSRLVQIEANVVIADKGNWRDVVERIGHIAEGRFEASPERSCNTCQHVTSFGCQLVLNGECGEDHRAWVPAISPQ